jgi:NADPH:quinone reductase-like Zn-dependent oxidoreductase
MNLSDNYLDGHRLFPRLMTHRLDGACTTTHTEDSNMMAFQLVEHGGPEALVLRTDLPEPEPGPGEVRIRVAAAGLNNTDIWSREGAYGTQEDPASRAGWKRVPLEFPRIQGGDIVGRIDSVGDGIDRSRIGQRVVVNPVIPGSDAASDGLRDCRLVGSEVDGGFAEYAVVPSDNAVAVDTPVEDTALAALPIAYLTAEHMLGRVALSAGETVLVTGASGGVGTALVQLARARGASVVAIAGSGKEAALSELGVTEFVPRENFERSGTAALPSGGESVEVVADVVAGPNLPPLLNALAYAGRYVTAGAIAGPLVEFDLRTVYLNQLTLVGSTLGTREDFRRLIAFVNAGTVSPPVAATYRLEELPRAQEHFLHKNFVGNIVVQV